MGKATHIRRARFSLTCLRQCGAGAREGPLTTNAGSGSAIWIVDAETASYQALAYELIGNGHTVSFHEDLAEVAAILRSRPESTPRLAIVGAAQLSAFSSEVPVSFMVVAPFDAPGAARSAFERGAIDYFRKPLGADELTYKVERHLAAMSAAFAPSRASAADAGGLPGGPLTMNRTFLTVGYGKGVEVVLTPREFQILGLLYDAPDHCVTRASVFVSVWDGVKVCQKVLDVHVSKLRKKLKPLGISINFVRPSNYVLEIPGARQMATSANSPETTFAPSEPLAARATA